MAETITAQQFVQHWSKVRQKETAESADPRVAGIAHWARAGAPALRPRRV